MKQLNIEVEDSVKQALKILAAKNGTSIKFEAGRAIASYLEQIGGI